jgi:hypothetical protein
VRAQLNLLGEISITARLYSTRIYFEFQFEIFKSKEEVVNLKINSTKVKFIPVRVVIVKSSQVKFCNILTRYLKVVVKSQPAVKLQPSPILGIYVKTLKNFQRPKSVFFAKLFETKV